MTSRAARSEAREAAIAWALEMRRRRRLLFLDTETTGVDDAAEIIDIAVVDRDGNVLLNTLVRPSRPIPPDATAIHGIDDQMVASAPDWPAVYPTLRRVLDGATCVVYNADFDRRVIESATRRYGLQPAAIDWQCAMRQYAAYAGDWSAKYQAYRWQKLERAAQSVGSPMPMRHRALADALACRAVVFAMASAAAADRGAADRGEERSREPAADRGATDRPRAFSGRRRLIVTLVIAAALALGLLILLRLSRAI